MEELLPQMIVASYAIDVFAPLKQVVLDALGKSGDYVLSIQCDSHLLPWKYLFRPSLYVQLIAIEKENQNSQ